MSKIPQYGGSKIPPVTMDRNVAQVAAPAATLGAGENKTSVSTYLTKASTTADVIYDGDRQWAQITLTLQTAGPVAVSDKSSIAPVLSGKGQLLQTGVPTKFFIAKGTRLYVLSSSVNRISLAIEPVPWLEMIAALLGGGRVHHAPSLQVKGAVAR